MEKIHGTSAHIEFHDGKIKFFGGGIKTNVFAELFSDLHLATNMQRPERPKITIYGEAYGGKCQRMSNTYGKDLKFLVFDVRIGDRWLSVPDAASFARSQGLEFVWYMGAWCEIGVLNAFRDRPSEQAKRNGCGEDKMSEGIVIRPIINLTTNSGERICAKHKGEKFSETRTPREVTPEKAQILKEANAIAEEWATENRLKNILSHIEKEPEVTDILMLIKLMITDIEVEGADEVVMSQAAKKAIGTKTAMMVKQLVKERLK